MPTFMIRLVEDRGGIMKGGAAQVGSVLVASAIRSLTSCRARISSAPRLKISVIDDSCGTDFDRITSMPGTPLSAFSNGTVTSCSTSAGDSPRQIVWISTRGGANSGNTSTATSRSRATPNQISTTLRARTRYRNRRLELMIRLIMRKHPCRPGTSRRRQRRRLVTYAFFSSEDLRHRSREHLGAERRSIAQVHVIALDGVDLDGLADKGHRIGMDIDPGPAGQVVKHRGIRHDPMTRHIRAHFVDLDS